jgi:hypothetical protein
MEACLIKSKQSFIFGTKHCRLVYRSVRLKFLSRRGELGGDRLLLAIKVLCTEFLTGATVDSRSWRIQTMLSFHFLACPVIRFCQHQNRLFVLFSSKWPQDM